MIPLRDKIACIETCPKCNQKTLIKRFNPAPYLINKKFYTLCTNCLKPHAEETLKQWSEANAK